MKLLRGVWIGALFWVIIFFEVSILMFGFNLQPGVLYYIIHYIVILVLSILACLLYFRKAKAGLVRGMLLAIIMIVTGIVLDAVITIPLFVHNYAFFLDPFLLIGFLETVVVCGIVGAIKN